MGATDVTGLLIELSGGNRQALDALMPLVYDELRRMARSQLSGERAGHTLDSVALVNEAYLKLVQQQRLTPQNRAHFFATAAGAMRRILVDHARRRNAGKRGSGEAPLALDGLTAKLSDASAHDILRVDEALGRLLEIDELAGRIVECLYFAGLTHEEVVVALDTSLSTLRRRWRFARAWLERELK